MALCFLSSILVQAIFNHILFWGKVYSHLVRCATLCHIVHWMTTNKLMLNENKTEVICISSNYFNDQVSINQFSVDDTIVIPASSVRNIGVMFDNTMSMKNQVTSLCKAAHFHLRNIGRIRKSITYEACEKLIHALITSRLDYCNATLYGVTDGQHQRLQKMFNIAARILTLTPPSEDIETVLLETLHWLPVEQRIQYKILLLTFKVLHGLAPQYLSELLKLQVTERDTRQTDTNRLHQPVMNTRTLGDRAFVAAAPTLWNSLPVKTRLVDSIDTFKKQTKTHLFPSSHKWLYMKFA